MVEGCGTDWKVAREVINPVKAVATVEVSDDGGLNCCGGRREKVDGFKVQCRREIKGPDLRFLPASVFLSCFFL